MRLIDVDELEPDTDYDDGEYFAYSKTQIENAPTIEPKKKTGRCIIIGKGKTRMSIGNTYACSECGWETIGKVNYCPCCGARMEEEG